MKTCLVVLLSFVLVGGCAEAPMDSGPATIVRQDGVVRVDRALSRDADLWVSPDELPKVNGFELKPEGACLDALCVPASEDGPEPLLMSRGGARWFGVSRLSARLGQPVVAAADARVWSLGAWTLEGSRPLSTALAPDFELPDRKGNLVRLRDFRGKKVLLVTWASW